MAWDVISHLSAPTSDQFNFTSLSLGSYQRVLLVLDGLTVGTDGAFIDLQLSTASTLRTSGYRYNNALRSSSGSTDTGSSSSAAAVRILGGSSSTWGVGNAASEAGAVRCFISNSAASVYKHVMADGGMVAPSGAFVRTITGGLLEQTGAIDGIRVLTSTGTLTAGTATLYGLPTS